MQSSAICIYGMPSSTLAFLAITVHLFTNARFEKLFVTHFDGIEHITSEINMIFVRVSVNILLLLCASHGTFFFGLHKLLRIFNSFRSYIVTSFVNNSGCYPAQWEVQYVALFLTCKPKNKVALVTTDLELVYISTWITGIGVWRSILPARVNLFRFNTGYYVSTDSPT